MSEEELIYISHGAGGDWFVVRSPDGDMGAEVRSLLQVRRTVYALRAVPRQPNGQRLIWLDARDLHNRPLRRRRLRGRYRDYADDPTPGSWWVVILALLLMAAGTALVVYAVAAYA